MCLGLIIIMRMRANSESGKISETLEPKKVRPLSSILQQVIPFRVRVLVASHIVGDCCCCCSFLKRCDGATVEGGAGGG